MHGIAVQGDTLNKETNHEPVDIIARTNELSPNISVKSLITRLSTDDPDTLDVHVYEVLPAADTDYDKVKVVADQLWLIKPLEEGQTTLKTRLRATDADGAFVEKMLRFEIVSEEKGGETAVVADKPRAEFKIYTVPSEGEMMIEGVGYDAEIAVYDLRGNKYKNVPKYPYRMGVRLNFHQLPSDIYILRIVDDGLVRIAKLNKQ
jgi:hypothetical protein